MEIVELVLRTPALVLCMGLCRAIGRPCWTRTLLGQDTCEEFCGKRHNSCHLLKRDDPYTWCQVLNYCGMFHCRV